MICFSNNISFEIDQNYRCTPLLSTISGIRWVLPPRLDLTPPCSRPLLEKWGYFGFNPPPLVFDHFENQGGGGVKTQRIQLMLVRTQAICIYPPVFDRRKHREHSDTLKYSHTGDRRLCMSPRHRTADIRLSEGTVETAPKKAPKKPLKKPKKASKMPLKKPLKKPKKPLKKTWKSP